MAPTKHDEKEKKKDKKRMKDSLAFRMGKKNWGKGVEMMTH